MSARRTQRLADAVRVSGAYRRVSWAVRVCAVAVCGLIALSACTSQAATEAPIATLTLIPPTATATNTPVPPTPTIDETVSREIIPQVTTATATTSAPDGASLIERDPIASQLTFIAQRLVADQTGLPTRRIRVVDVRAFTWSDSSLGCPLPGQFYLQATVDGYRIELEAGETTYIFHTDVDRVLPCAAENERLPILESTAEVTAEAN